jgi:eukaryotic-like serine/threonine-protein kinase
MIRPVISTEGDGVLAANRAVPVIPDYDLLRRIGAGSYGEVWLARSTATGALRAIKVVYRSTFSEARPFQREFEGLLKFEAVSRAHPSQLALFHVGRNEAEGWFYYVMELADSKIIPFPVSGVPPEPAQLDDYSPKTLRTELEAGRLPAERVLEIACALTEALGHLHGKGLIHRDLKPSNIIFVQGRPKLADIGLVTDASTGGDRSIVGTEGYLPPEGPGTPAADIFALGKVLYEALTGLDRRQFPELPADLREWQSGLAGETARRTLFVCPAACLAALRPIA